MNQYKILTGTAIEVETQLNELNIKNFLIVLGLASTNELTTVIVEISPRQ